MLDTPHPILDAARTHPPPHTFDPAGTCAGCAARGPLVGCIARESPQLAALRASHAALAAREAAARPARGPARALPGQLRLFGDDGAPARPEVPRAPVAAPQPAALPAPDTSYADTPRKHEPPTVLLCAQCTLDVVRALAALGRGPGGIGYEWAVATAGGA